MHLRAVATACFVLLQLQFVESKSNETLVYSGKRSPPAIKKLYSIESIRYGATFSLPCVANGGAPTPSVRWYFNDSYGWRRVAPNYERRLNRTHVHLVINDARMEEAGFYQCRATNIVGKDKWRVQVFVGKPSRPHGGHIICLKDKYSCALTWEQPEYAGHTNSTDFVYIVSRVYDGKVSAADRNITTSRSFAFDVPPGVSIVHVELWSYVPGAGKCAYPATVNVVWNRLVVPTLVVPRTMSMLEVILRNEERRRQEWAMQDAARSTAFTPKQSTKSNFNPAAIMIAVCVSVCAFPLALTAFLVCQTHIRNRIELKRRGTSGISSAGRLPKDLAEMLSHPGPPAPARVSSSSLTGPVVRFQDEENAKSGV